MHFSFTQRILLALALSGLLLVPVASAQDSNAVPMLVKFSGTLTNGNGKPLTGIVGVTFYLYRDPQGGAPLWMETQNVSADNQGHYTVQLGSTTNQGLPSDVFVSGEARWLAVQVSGQAEQPRVMLLSVPYALKAGDAATVGGMPPSAFVLATPSGSSPNANSSSGTSPSSSATSALAGAGTTDFVPLWSNSTTLGNSVLFQSGTGGTAKVGLNTTTPVSTLDVKGGATIRGLLSLPARGAATATGGKDSGPQNFTASSYNSASNAAENQIFQWQAEPVGNNTSSPSGKYNLLFASGTSTPAETGLSISSSGLFTFASGQTFPGTGGGTVTSVGSGAGLTGGPITSSGTLSITNAGVTNTMLQYSSLTVTAGTGLSGGGPVSLGGSTTLNVANASCPTGEAAVALPLSCAFFASLGANNFNGNQSVTGNLGASGEVAAGGNPYPSAASGTVEVDAGHHNTGGTSPALTFAGGGELIISNRNSGTNPYGLDFFTNNTPRMSITNSGQVGIGTQTPSVALEVDAPIDTVQDGARLYGASDDNGTGGGAGARGIGGSDTGPAASAGDGGDFFGGNSVNGSGGDGVYGTGGPGPINGEAGYFYGDVVVTGNLYKGGGAFKIDHPLDPANKYLYHSFVESPDMMDIYNGNAVLDANGEAVVQLPDWFQALNGNFRYQLTCIGGFAPVYIAEEISNSEFRIGGGKAGMKVSWQVTGIRQDAWANAHRIPTEVDKPARERGFYIHPELYGQPANRQIEWVRHPAMMKRMQQMRAGQLKLARTR
jgi:trimeric autotransporter adhesin